MGLFFTISHGIFFGHITDDNQFNKFVHNADKALYKIKESGRNGFCLLSEDDAINNTDGYIERFGC